MTADRPPVVSDAKNRAHVRFPGHTPGTTMHGSLIAIRRGKATIVLPSGKHVSRPADQVRLLEVVVHSPTDPAPPRVQP